MNKRATRGFVQIQCGRLYSSHSPMLSFGSLHHPPPVSNCSWFSPTKKYFSIITLLWPNPFLILQYNLFKRQKRNIVTLPGYRPQLVQPANFNRPSSTRVATRVWWERSRRGFVQLHRNTATKPSGTPSNCGPFSVHLPQSWQMKLILLIRLK